MRLTSKQLAIFSEIESYVAKHNYPPSIRELCEKCNLKSSSTMHGYLNRLKDKGLVSWEPNSPRTLHIKR